MPEAGDAGALGEVEACVEAFAVEAAWFETGAAEAGAIAFGEALADALGEALGDGLDASVAWVP